MVINEIRDNEEQIKVTKAVGQAQHRRWTTWEEVERRKLSWSEIWSMELLVLQFLIHTTYDVLPTPKNMSVWNRGNDPKCHKFGAPGTLNIYSVPVPNV